MKLKYKILIPITFFITLILGVVSVYYIQFTQNNIKKISTNQLQSLGYIAKDRTTDYLQYKQEQVFLFNSR